jgi:periplasmic protein TonB
MTEMSVADGRPGILLPADPGFRESRDRATRGGRLRRGAIAAAALAHAAVILAVIVHWPSLFPVAPVERPIPVTLVAELPPPPPPRAQPTPPPAPPPAQERVSGSDTQTTAPPKAPEKDAAAAAPKPEPPPPPRAQPTPPPAPPPAQERVSGSDTQTTAPPKAPEKDAAAAAPKPEPPPPVEAPAKTAAPQSKPDPVQEPHPPKPKLATRETAPTQSPGSVNRAPGERTREGDPYLNRLFALIEQHRSYPANAVGSLGLRLEGTSVYLIAVRADGALVNTRLERSAGADILDQTALKMIEQAAPFPPPPQNEFPGPGVVLEVTIHLFPGAG